MKINELVKKTNVLKKSNNALSVTQNNMESIQGRNRFLKTTGLSGLWLDKMQEWHIITPKKTVDQLIYSPEDVIIGKLVVEMDRLGLGPKNGYFPEDLKLYAHFVRDFVLPNHMKYLKDQAHLLESSESREKGMKKVEVIGRFIYYLYLKTIKEGASQILDCIENFDDIEDALQKKA